MNNTFVVWVSYNLCHFPLYIIYPRTSSLLVIELHVHYPADAKYAIRGKLCCIELLTIPC